MKITTMLLPSLLLLGGAAAIPSAEATSFEATSFEMSSLKKTSLHGIDAGFETLEADFKLTLDMWMKDVRAASAEERTELLASHPARDYWEQFAGLASTGDGQAMLWMISYSVYTDLGTSERTKLLTASFGKLAKHHSSEEWFAASFGQIKMATEMVGVKATLAFYETVIEQTTSDENRAGAFFGAGFLLLGQQDSESQARGEDYLSRVESELVSTSWGQKMEGARADAAVGVGRMAPDFTGKTVDGFEFDLSDYKGKVVLLDFYGFW